MDVLFSMERSAFSVSAKELDGDRVTFLGYGYLFQELINILDMASRAHDYHFQWSSFSFPFN
jgi:hypothetical protein